MTTYAVKFGRPTYRTIESKIPGKKPIVYDDEPIYTSKCGRFRIEKHMMSSGRGNFNSPEYRVFRVVDEKRLDTCDTYGEARATCELELNPDWEG